MSADGSLAARFHDIDTPRAGAAEIAWYEARLPRDAGPILDVMAGSGRLLVPLLEAGFQVHGVDVSDAMLKRCEQRLASGGRATQLFRQNVTTLNLPARYAAAFIAGGSFQLLTDPVGALDALLRIRAHLVDPALLLLDLFVPAQAEHPPGAPNVEVRTVVAGAGARIALRSETSCDVARRRIEAQRRYELRDGVTVSAREDDILALTWYNEGEALTLLGDAGYRDARIETAEWRRDDGRHFAAIAKA